MPEPAPADLARGDTGPLAAFGRSSGLCLLLGLVLAATSPSGPPVGLEVLLTLAGFGVTAKGAVVPRRSEILRLNCGVSPTYLGPAADGVR